MQRYKKKLNSQFSILNSQLNLNRGVELLSHFGFLVAIGLTAWFHHLRNTFGESAMILFNLINNPELWTATTWYSANWFQNVITILAVKGNLSLPLVSIVFSASPMIFSYLVFLLTYYGFKQKFSGVFLLLLLLGINASFFEAVNTTFSVVVLLYMFVALIRFIFEKHFTKQHNDFCALFEMSVFGTLAIFAQLIGRFLTNTPLTERSITPCPNIDFSEWYPSFMNFLGKQAINTYIIIAYLALFLCVFWMVRKNYKELTVFLFFSVLLVLMAWHNKHLFIFDYEQRFLFLLAFVLIAMNGFIWERFPLNKLRFGILIILVFLAIGGQLRMLPKFEKRQEHTLRLLNASAAIPAEKIALSEDLQVTEKYINSKYLAFETPIITALHNLPQKSIFFIPKDVNYFDDQVFNNVPNQRYFRFSDQSYTILEEPLIPRKLIVDTIFDIDSVYYVGKKTQWSVNYYLGHMLELGDSVEVSVWRKGSDRGLLVISDRENPNDIFYIQQTVSEPDENGWQNLLFAFTLNQNKHPLKTYGWNQNYKNEDMFFKEFRVRIWRE
ncbi:MAG: hypothetical protein LBH22_05460 [Bacteroidales bacterium]|jgi:hypothetical protein|nr:hypothetical protein [Bacteroidales bacterium]